MARRAGARPAAAAAKRPKLDIAVGEEWVVTHDAPRAKRLFADMCGVVTATTACTVDLRFKIPRHSLALYSEFLGPTDEATVRFSAAHVARRYLLTAKRPFHLTVMQSKLTELLCPKSMLKLLAAGRGVVNCATLACCLAASLRRVLIRPPHRAVCSSAELARTKRDWAGWKQGTYLKSRAYASVRDVLLDQIVVTKGDAINHRALALTAYIGAKYDATLVKKLLHIKGALIGQRYGEPQCDEQIRLLIGEGGRGRQTRSLYAAKALLQALRSG